MPWITTAPISSGSSAKHSPIARMMPSLSALRLAGRFRPTVSTAPDLSTLSSGEVSSREAAAFPMEYYVLTRIVMFYNYWRGSQLLSRLKHRMHIDHHAIGVARGRGDENVLHQPAIVFVAGLELRHRAEIDQFGIDRLAAFQLLQQLDRP